MYSATFKHSPIWRSEIPALASPEGLNLRESNLPTADLSIPLHHPSPSNSIPPTATPRITPRSLHIISLTTSDLTPTTKPTTIARLTRLLQETGGTDIGVIFLLSSPNNSNNTTSLHPSTTAANAGPASTISAWEAYNNLQSLILTSLEMKGTHLPILPLLSPSSLVQTVKAHIDAFTSTYSHRSYVSAPPIGVMRSKAGMRPSDTGTRARDILPYATATAPTQLLNEHAVNVLTDTISDLRTLARAGSAHGGGNAVEEAGSDVIIEDPGEGNQRWGGGSNGGSARGMDDWMMGMECGDGRDGRSNDGVVRLKKQIQAELRGLIDEKEVEGMWEFWAGEWVVE